MILAIETYTMAKKVNSYLVIDQTQILAVEPGDKEFCFIKLTDKTRFMVKVNDLKFRSESFKFFEVTDEKI